METNYPIIIEDLVSGRVEKEKRKETIRLYGEFVDGDEAALLSISPHSFSLLRYDVGHMEVFRAFISIESKEHPRLKKLLDASALLQIDRYIDAKKIFDELGGFEELDSFYRLLYVKCMNAIKRRVEKLRLEDVRDIMNDLQNYREVLLDLAYNSLYSEGGVGEFDTILSELTGNTIIRWQQHGGTDSYKMELYVDGSTEIIDSVEVRINSNIIDWVGLELDQQYTCRILHLQNGEWKEHEIITDLSPPRGELAPTGANSRVLSLRELEIIVRSVRGVDYFVNDEGG